MGQQSDLDLQPTPVERQRSALVEDVMRRSHLNCQEK